MFYKCFIVHVTTSYLQHVFNMLKHLQKRFATLFCKCFSVKHLQNIFRGKTVKHLQNICKTFLEVVTYVK